MRPEDFDVVGESHYQGDLERLAGGRTRDGVDVEVMAALIPEDGNAYDPRAVRVEVRGLTVGYLDRESARAYRRLAKARGIEGGAVLCPARIVGGWDRGKKDRGHFGVRLEWKEEPAAPDAKKARAKKKSHDEAQLDIDLAPRRKDRKEKRSGSGIGCLLTALAFAAIVYYFLRAAAR